MMGQSVWHRDDIGRMCESVALLALEANTGQSPEFLRGVVAGITALMHAFGVKNTLPEWREPTAVEVLPADVPRRITR